jgi:aspartate-semialdehyde dehydrogenase
LVISTYQSFTGTGAKAVAQYESERDGIAQTKEEMAYHYQIFENCIHQCDVFLDNGYTKEEMKLVNETKKILSDFNINITATAVRVPVNGGHSESINVEFKTEFELQDVIDILSNTEGIIVKNNNKEFEYPMPLYAKNKNEVFVGRIRRDESKKNALNLWVVADNLRKGAATNAVQIVNYLHKNKLIL